MKRFFTVLIVTVSLTAGICGSNFAATEVSIGAFAENLDYDVYIQYGQDDISVVEKVEIARIEEIHDKKYLVVKSHAFKLQGEEGFILWDAVVAILPNDDFKIQRAEKIRYR